MKRAVSTFCAAVFLLMSGAMATGCDPQECKSLKAKVCSLCGDSSGACTKLADKSDSAENCGAILTHVTSMETELDKLNDAAKRKTSMDAFCKKVEEDRPE